MNKLSAELFLDLISDPAKYRTYLTRIEDERTRLEEIVATVGKASELDKLRKDLEKQAEANEKDLAKKIKEVDDLAERRFIAVSSAQSSADAAQEAANKSLQEATDLKEEAINLKKSFEGRDKALRQAEESVKQQQAQVAQMMVEYEDRLAKLRSVMA